MKKLLSIILFLSVFSFLTQVAAITRPMNLRLYSKIQDIETKEFELILEVDSVIKNDRVDLIWELPRGLTSKDNLQEAVKLDDGINKYTIKVVPQGQLEGEVIAKIKTYEDEKSYFASQKAYISIDNNLLLKEQSQQFSQIVAYTQQESLFRNIALVFLVIFLILSIVHFFAKKFKSETYEVKTPRNSRILKAYAKYKAKSN